MPIAAQCEDNRRHPIGPCKHRAAVEIHCARVAGKPMSASAVVDGLRVMAEQHARQYDAIFGRL